MTKSEIIKKVLKEFRNESEAAGIPARDDAAYERVIVAAMEKSLRNVEPDTNIRTCEDFSSLYVKCCDCCHDIYQHYEIALIDIETGGSAWICCAIARALNPKMHANFPEHAENMTFNELLMEFIRRCEDAK
jgi:hypothetical protein